MNSPAKAAVPSDSGEVQTEHSIVIEVTTGNEQGRRFALERHGNFMVGRAREAHFRLPKDDRRVSRVHFLIEFNPPLCRLLDLGSRNGTRVNGKPVRTVDLQHGDTIEAGRTAFRVHAHFDMPIAEGAPSISLSPAPLPAHLPAEGLPSPPPPDFSPALEGSMLAPARQIKAPPPLAATPAAMPPLAEDSDALVHVSLVPGPISPATPLPRTAIPTASPPVGRPAPRVAPKPVPATSPTVAMSPAAKVDVTEGWAGPERVPAAGGVNSGDEAHLEVPGYRVIRELGRGGMGIVYLVTRLSDGRQLALKTIRPAQTPQDKDLKKFVREAGILMQFEHRYIVSFREMGKGDGFAYFTMDYIDGLDAAAIIKRGGPMEPGRAVRLVGHLLEALEYAHALGYVHRDIKPSNLLVSGVAGSETGHLADFGLARVYHDSPMSGLTMMGDIGGTVAFMAPEQVTNFREAKPAADQYAAAATLYYLLTGGRHVYDFDSTAPEKCLLKKLVEPHIPFSQRRPDLPALLAAAIDKGLAREPNERFRNVQAMRQTLSTI